MKVRNEQVVFPLLCVAIVACRLIAQQVLFAYDDAFITFRYARNLAEGSGLVYNPGEWVLGTTAPAFALLSSLLYLVGLPLPGAVQVFNIAVDLGIFAMGHRMIEARQPASADGRQAFPLASVFLGLFIAISPALSRVTIGAMESNLFLLVSLIAIWLFRNGRERNAVALASFSYFLRPEGVILIGVLGLIKLSEREYRETAVMAAVSIAIVSPGLLLLTILYGQPLSQSVVAKLGTAGRSTVSEVIRAFYLFDPMLKLLLPFAAFGAWKSTRERGAQRLLLIWLTCYTGFYLFSRPMTVSSWYAEVPFFCCLYFAAEGIQALLAKVRIFSNPSLTLATSIAALVLSAGTWSVIYMQEGPSRVEADVRAKYRSWAATHTTSRTRMMAVDIGVIGYYSRAYVHDLYGLVSPEMLAFKSDTEAVRVKKPDYVFSGYVASEMSSHVTPDYVEEASFIPRYPAGSGVIMKHWFVEYHLYRRR